MKAVIAIAGASLICLAGFGQTAVRPAVPGVPAAAAPKTPVVTANGTPKSVPTIPAEPKAAKAETLRYSINWPSGLSLGEGTLTSTRAGTDWTFSLQLDAAVPGFPVREKVNSKASADYCSTESEKEFSVGKKKAHEKTTFDQEKLTATRETLEGGGKSDISIPRCTRDALTFLFFVRRELAQGRLPPQQKVLFGAPYQVRVEYMGTQNIQIADAQVQADRLTGTIKGPASDETIEMFFARDAGRTPLLIRAPMAMGKFSMELTR
jgi:hypothetical protein